MGLYYIRIKLFSIPLTELHSRFEECMGCANTDPNSLKYKVIAITSDIAQHRLYKPVCSNNNTDANRSFVKVHFVNKGLDAINISNMLHNKHIRSKVPCNIPTVLIINCHACHPA